MSKETILEASQISPTLLTERQVLFFRQTGYFRSGQRFPEQDIVKIKNNLEETFAAAVEPVRRDSTGGVVIRLSRLFERHRIFHEVFTSPLVLGPLQSLLGPNIEFVLNRHNHATINTPENKSSRLHRDVLQWSRPVVTAIVYLEDSSLDTGCTYIIPASHFLSFVGTPNNGGTWMDEHHIYSDLLNQALPIPVSAGGILFFDSLAFHAAGANRSNLSRMAISGAYHSVDELSFQKDDPNLALVLGERLYRGDS